MTLSVSTDVYLDIETDHWQRLTVIGFRSAATGLVQLVGEQISPRALHAALPASGRLFTYNGHCFDLPVIRKQLGMDLRTRFDSWDLRFVCARHGLKGGQKAVEHAIGLQRALEGMSGRDAIWLWERHRRGDLAALATLLHYNAEDVDGLASIHEYLAARGELTRREPPVRSPVKWGTPRYNPRRTPRPDM